MIRKRDNSPPSRNVRPRVSHAPVLDPERENSRSLVEFDRAYSNGVLQMITLRPIRRAGNRYSDISILGRYATQIRTEIYRALRTRGLSDPQIRSRASLSVFMYNWNNEGNSNARNNVTMTQLNGKLFLDMFEEATASGSNADLDLYDVVWKVWINPASITSAGAGDESRKQGVYKFSWRLKPSGEIDTKKLGCAAKVLALGMERKESKYTIDLRRSTGFTEDVYKLQQELNFNEPLDVTVLELAKFVDLYPKYRLAIFCAVHINPTIYVGNEYVYNEDSRLDFTIYVFNDILKQHYRLMTSPQEWVFGELNSRSYRWCHKCCFHISLNSKKSCRCGSVYTYVPRPLVECPHCNKFYQKSNKHVCGEKKCMYCQLAYKEGFVGTHRCPLYIDTAKTCKVFKGDENEYLRSEYASLGKNEKEKPDYELWVWDIESHFVLTDQETNRYIVDEDGHYVLDDDGQVEVKIVSKLAQLGNYIYCKNVFTGEEKEFESMEDFIFFAVAKRNDGYNYFLAHNSSGYDSRLLFEVATKMSIDPPTPMFKGSRMMRMSIKNCVFQDTMFHLTDSLKNLGKAYNLDVEKGYFPHLFSTLDNLDYEGPIPDIEYFDLTFTCKTEKDFNDFHEWYATWEGLTWNYRHQRKLYCRNDVVMLAEIVKIYHDGMIASLKDYPYLTISPWFSPTMAGYVHKLMIRHLHEGYNISQMKPTELQEYARTTWCALEPEEHYYAKKALRGGMTNICKYISDGPIHYQDIQSAYPSVQMDVENLYPVGSPIIEVFDSEFYPCGFCYSKDKCSHSYTQKVENSLRHRQRKIQVIEPKMGDMNEYIANFFGIITVDIEPPRDLYHPLIQGFDREKKKVIGTLEPIFKETIPSCILHEAIKAGYVVKKIYRGDRYLCQESKFRNGLLGDMYVNKMKNAGKIPVEHRERMKKTFRNKFNIDLGDMDKYEKNAVLKKIAKGPVTAAWGKHAESVDHPQGILYNRENEDGQCFYEELLANKSELTNVRTIGSNVLFNYKENRTFVRPELHRGYLPVAVFVTAYGRIKLWRELVKIDPRGTPRDKLRVIMYDTDSIVYEAKEGYRIPEGDCLGDWETEDIEKDHDGIVAFRAIAPKSYAIVCGDGYSSMKLKGAVIKHAHSNMINPDTFKELVMSKKPGAVPKFLGLPQMSFDYTIGGGDMAMTTRYFTKYIQFNEDDVKGTFSWEDYRGYPVGYNK